MSETKLEERLAGTSQDELDRGMQTTEGFSRDDLESRRREGRARTGQTTNKIAQVLLWVCCVGGVVIICALVTLAVKYLIYVYGDEQRTADFVKAFVWTLLVALSTLFFEHKIVDKD